MYNSNQNQFYSTKANPPRAWTAKDKYRRNHSEANIQKARPETGGHLERKNSQDQVEMKESYKILLDKNL
jgi:hypothetical protein